MELSHISPQGNARMVDVSEKQETNRKAVAHAKVITTPEVIALMKSGQNAKGDVLTAALVAGIQAGKKTHELIPMCHNIFLNNISISFQVDDSGEIDISAAASAYAKTGVEMEALTSVTVAALTVYDMLKAADKGIEITEVFLTEKSGGKSGDYKRQKGINKNG